MKKHDSWLVAGMLVITALISLLLQWLICPIRSEPVYQVDLKKIMAVRVMQKKQSGPQVAEDNPLSVRQAIKLVARHHLVLVSPAVIEGATDITEAVLSLLDLPTQVPRINRQSVTPAIKDRGRI